MDAAIVIFMLWLMKNKRFAKLFPLLFCSAMTLTMVSCIDTLFGFDENLLVGKWVSGTEYYCFGYAGTGYTWDTSDDVSESEAQQFTWEYDGLTNTLTIIHQMEMGGVVPKSYTITNLTESVLEFTDKYGRLYSYSRVE